MQNGKLTITDDGIDVPNDAVPFMPSQIAEEEEYEEIVEDLSPFPPEDDGEDTEEKLLDDRVVETDEYSEEDYSSLLRDSLRRYDRDNPDVSSMDDDDAYLETDQESDNVDVKTHRDLKAEANSARHKLLHKPPLPQYCEVCGVARARQRHRKKRWMYRNTPKLWRSRLL